MAHNIVLIRPKKNTLEFKGEITLIVYTNIVQVATFVGMQAGPVLGNNACELRLSGKYLLRIMLKTESEGKFVIELYDPANDKSVEFEGMVYLSSSKSAINLNAHLIVGEWNTINIV